jgi:hypothetical protein
MGLPSLCVAGQFFRKSPGLGRAGRERTGVWDSASGTELLRLHGSEAGIWKVTKVLGWEDRTVGYWSRLI